MKNLSSTFLALIFTALLCGCPNNKLPKVPPKVPEPKAVAFNGLASQNGVAINTMHRQFSKQ